MLHQQTNYRPRRAKHDSRASIAVSIGANAIKKDHR
jgi:hypothetical protein